MQKLKEKMLAQLMEDAKEFSYWVDETGNPSVKLGIIMISLNMLFIF